MEHTTLRTRIKSHYHWVVAAVVLIEFAIACGFNNNLYSLYLIPVTKELGVTRGAFSVSPSIRYFASFISNLSFGLLYTRYGYRKMASVTLFLTAGIYLLYASAQNLVPFYVGAAVVGLIESFNVTAAASRMITEWFHRHKGLILGIVLASSGICSSVFSVLMTGVMEKGSFRDAMAISAACLAGAAILVAVFARNKPAQMELKPMGEGEEKAEKKRAAKVVSRDWEGFTQKELQKKPFFYIQLLATGLFTVSVYAVYPSIISHAQDVGLSASEAALLHSAMFLILAAAKVLEGALSDKFGARPVMCLCLLFNVTSIVILVTAKSFLLIFLALILFAFPFAATTVMVSMLLAEQFGRRSFGTLLGVFMAVSSLSGVVASPTLNFTYDKTGSYVPGYLIMLVLGSIATVLYLVAFHGAVRERAKFEVEKAK